MSTNSDNPDIRQTRQTFAALDAGKFIAALLVLTLHVHPLASNPDGDYWLTCLCRIAVPFFFVTSSFLFFKRGGDIRKYVSRILILYAVWFVIESPLIIHDFFLDSDESLPRKLLLFGRGLFINSTFPASWFLTASWQGMLLVWWLSRKLSRKWLVIIGLVCFLSTLPETMWYGLIAGTPVRPVYWWYVILFCPANSFIIAIPYCIAGKFLAESEPPQKLTLCILGAAVPLSILEAAICRETQWMTDSFLGLLFIAPCLVWLVANIRAGIGAKTSKCLRSMSTLIYLCHLPVKLLLMHQMNLKEDWILFLLTLAICLVFALTVYLLSLRIRPLKYLY
ncbi:MAG: acyltransferase [Bacteroidales bacterium]|nr:acyltransferase [Bacteroidales bacterium]